MSSQYQESFQYLKSLLSLSKVVVQRETPRGERIIDELEDNSDQLHRWMGYSSFRHLESDFKQLLEPHWPSYTHGPPPLLTPLQQFIIILCYIYKDIAIEDLA